MKFFPETRHNGTAYQHIVYCTGLNSDSFHIFKCAYLLLNAQHIRIARTYIQIYIFCLWGIWTLSTFNQSCNQFYDLFDFLFYFDLICSVLIYSSLWVYSTTRNGYVSVCEKWQRCRKSCLSFIQAYLSVSMNEHL